MRKNKKVTTGRVSLKKILCVLTGALIMVTMSPFTLDLLSKSGHVSAATTGSKLAQYATAQKGKSKNTLGINAQEWCAAFVRHCAKKTGNADVIGGSNIVFDQAYQTVKLGGEITFVNKSAWQNSKGRFSKYSQRCKYNNQYKPKEGDLYIQAGVPGKNCWFGHVGIVRNNSSTTSKYYTVEGNTSCSCGKHANYKNVEYKTRYKSNKSTLCWQPTAFVRPKYKTAVAPRKCKVQFNANRGEGRMAEQTVTMQNGLFKVTTANKFTRSGYKFIGWHIQKISKGISYWITDVNKTGIVWTKNAPVAKKKLYPDGTRTFGTSVADGDTLVFWACWSVIPKCKVQFNANRGEGSMAEQTVTMQDGLFRVTTANKFTRSGYEFIGWHIQKMSKGISYWITDVNEKGIVWTKNAPVAEKKLYPDGTRTFGTSVADGDTLVFWACWSEISKPDDKGTIVSETEYLNKYKNDPNYTATPMYRYATRTKSTTTSGYDALSGWTKYDSKTSTTISGYKFGTPIAMNTSYANDRKTVNSSVDSGYYYYAYVVANPNKAADWTYYADSSRANVVTHMKRNFSNSAVWSEGRLRYFWYISPTDLGGSWSTVKINKTVPYCDNSNVAVGTTSKTGTHWYDIKMKKYNRCYKIKTTVTTNYFYKWSEWSSWSDWTTDVKITGDAVKKDSTVMYLVEHK